MNDTGSPPTLHDAISGVLEELWQNIGIPVFLMNNVVKGCTKPYVTYSYSLPGAHKKSAEYAVIRTYSADFAELNALTERANALIPPEGLIITVPGDRGLIKLSRGTPFNEAVPDADYLMKARKINYFITCYAD